MTQQKVVLLGRVSKSGTLRDLTEGHEGDLTKGPRNHRLPYQRVMDNQETFTPWTAQDQLIIDARTYEQLQKNDSDFLVDKDCVVVIGRLQSAWKTVREFGKRTSGGVRHAGTMARALTQAVRNDGSSVYVWGSTDLLKRRRTRNDLLKRTDLCALVVEHESKSNGPIHLPIRGNQSCWTEVLKRNYGAEGCSVMVYNRISPSDTPSS